MATLADVAVAAQVIVRGRPQPGFPVEPNTAAGDVLWLGPDEWLVLGGREADHPTAAAAVDVSAGLAVFELSGPDARDVLAQGCSLDLRPRAFGPGRCAQTLLARSQVILHCSGEETFRILVRPSFTTYLRAWLDEAVASLSS